MEVDLRNAGVGCIDNPVAVLSDFLSKGIPLRIIMRKDQEELVKELLEISEYKVVSRKEEGETVIIEAEK